MIPIPPADGTRVVSGLLALLETLDLTQPRLDPEVVHQIRVVIKQTCAWLKMCRGLTGNTPAIQQPATLLRSLSAALAGQRDRDVALQTLTKLARKYPGKKAQHLIDELCRVIAGQRPPQSPEMPPLGAVTDQVRQELLPFLQLALPSATQQEVVRRRYTKVCKRGKAALKSRRCAELHAWRKQVKTLGYQLAMVSVNEADMEKLLARITRLGSKLGDVHDLCCLQTLIEETVLPRRQDLAAAPLFIRIDRERDTLLKTIHRLYRHVCQGSVHWMLTK